MKYVVSVGGGISSTLLLPLRAIERYGRDNVDLVMAWLPNEDDDVLRLIKAVENLTGKIVKMIGSGETPFDVFFRVGIMGNSRIDPCSRELKRETVARYMLENYDKQETIMLVGITAHESSHVDRRVAIRANWEKQGWKVEFPLAEDSDLTREKQIELCQRLVGFVPKLYKMGFSHNNCGGACIKAGQAQWARLLWYKPETYAEWRDNERLFQEKKGTGATILRRMVAGKTQPLSLADYEQELRVRWSTMFTDPFDGLEETPACVYCEAM